MAQHKKDSPEFESRPTVDKWRPNSSLGQSGRDQVPRAHEKSLAVDSNRSFLIHLVTVGGVVALLGAFAVIGIFLQFHRHEVAEQVLKNKESDATQPAVVANTNDQGKDNKKDQVIAPPAKDPEPKKISKTETVLKEITQPKNIIEIPKKSPKIPEFSIVPQELAQVPAPVRILPRPKIRPEDTTEPSREKMVEPPPVPALERAKVNTELLLETAEPKCERFGTKINFLSSPSMAFTRASKDPDKEKLVMILHIAGNFEDKGFT